MSDAVPQADTCDSASYAHADQAPTPTPVCPSASEGAIPPQAVTLPQQKFPISKSEALAAAPQFCPECVNPRGRAHASFCQLWTAAPYPQGFSPYAFDVEYDIERDATVITIRNGDRVLVQYIDIDGEVRKVDEHLVALPVADSPDILGVAYPQRECEVHDGKSDSKDGWDVQRTYLDAKRQYGPLTDAMVASVSSLRRLEDS